MKLKNYLLNLHINKRTKYLLFISFIMIYGFGATFHNNNSKLPWELINSAQPRLLGSEEITYIPQDASRSYSWVRDDVKLTTLTYYKLEYTLSYGDVVYYSIETSKNSEGIESFVCDETNYNLFKDGKSCSVYNLQDDAHVLYKSFTAPSSETWYFVIYNKEIFSITFDACWSLNTEEVPDYYYTYDYYKSGEIIEPGESDAYLLNTYSDSRVSGELETFISADYLDVYIMDEENYNHYKNGESYSFIYDDLGDSFDFDVNIYDNDNYYLVVSAEDSGETVVYSLGYDIKSQSSYSGNYISGSDGVLAFLSILILLILIIGPIALIIVLVKKKRKKKKMVVEDALDMTAPPVMNLDFNGPSNFDNNIDGFSNVNNPAYNYQPMPAPPPVASSQNLNLKSCPQCGRSVPLNAQFCSYCGYSFQSSNYAAGSGGTSGRAIKRCPQCGRYIPANAQFCGYCGYHF
ncbi:MAG: zinc ribbon domain-containing protein [Promethearchaeota archaeon]